MTPWETWCLDSLTKIVAPRSQANVDTLWAWSYAETAPYDLMRWNNPLNTTEKWPGSRDSGAQPGARDVQIYATVQNGIDATDYTLIVEPYYGAIVANLRTSLPRQQWGLYSTAATELHAWGTGSAWLTRQFPAAPQIGDKELDFFPRKASSGEISWAGPSGKRGLTPSEWSHLSAGGAKYTDLSDADYDTIPNVVFAANVTVDNTAVLAAIADLKTHPAVVTDPSVLAIVTRLEGAFRTA